MSTRTFPCKDGDCVRSSLSALSHMGTDPVIAQKANSSLFSAARDLRQTHFPQGIFVYGFIYLSTFCRNNCRFCLYRNANTHLERYRKSTEAVLDIGRRLADEGVHLLDLTLGEDPYYASPAGFDELLELIRRLREETGLSLMVSPGVLEAHRYPLLREAGADWFACYQETHNRTLFALWRTEQVYDVRLESRRLARQAGLLTEDGMLCGIGETEQDVADSIRHMAAEPLAQCRVMGYVPHEDVTPDSTPSLFHDELKLIASLRHAAPDKLIPASLDVDGLDGLADRLNAGANVVTSIVPSGCGLAGVASGTRDIENNRRSVGAVRETLERLGLKMASANEYQSFVRARADCQRQGATPCA